VEALGEDLDIVSSCHSDGPTQKEDIEVPSRDYRLLHGVWTAGRHDRDPASVELVEPRLCLPPASAQDESLVRKRGGGRVAAVRCPRCKHNARAGSGDRRGEDLLDLLGRRMGVDAGHENARGRLATG
jgi:hypothetical protein